MTENECASVKAQQHADAQARANIRDASRNQDDDVVRDEVDDASLVDHIVPQRARGQ